MRAETASGLQTAVASHDGFRASKDVPAGLDTPRVFFFAYMRGL